MKIQEQHSFSGCRYLMVVMAAIVVSSSAGCASGGRIIMENQLNNSIGNIVGSNSSFENRDFMDKIDMGDVIQYYQLGKLTGCEISFLVDKKSMRILSWQYLSSPDRCWSGKGGF